jgi:LPS O-antigen subunit length determinant protein (WzzB/FepE family)
MAAVDDAGKKAEILASKRWRRAMFEMSEWLSAQKIYDQKQVEKLKADFTARVNRMSATELQYMLADMEAKFQILETPEAEDARAWLAQYLSLLADKKREEVIAQLPNVATMTAAQLRDEIARIEERRTALERQQAAVQQLHSSSPNPWTQSTKMAQQAYIRDHQATGGYSSPYRSPATNQRPFENVNTMGPNVGYYVGAYGGFGMIFNNGF